MAQDQITIGLDFGTHQSKVCVERKNKAELEYQFFKFPDTHGRFQFTLPSIIHIDPEGIMSYGYVPRKKQGKIIRYFKQATFTTVNVGLNQEDAQYYSIWYLAYIIFDLEAVYGQNFTIQMGVPSDGAKLEQRRRIAVSLVLSAYNLVENVFDGDCDAFLKTPISELRTKTTIIPYTKEGKDEYGILVFPEAYACLMPLVADAKIDGGLSLMVDIGGGTTDISFFTIVKQQDRRTRVKTYELKVYDFMSIDKGLNFLTQFDKVDADGRLDSNVRNHNELQRDSVNKFKNELNTICSKLRGRLYREFKSQGNLSDDVFNNGLKNRPIVYTGGGSCFDDLRIGYHDFKGVIHITHENWRHELVDDIDEICNAGLCPILSTAYGLAISRQDDHISCEPFRELFSGIRQTKTVQSSPKKSSKIFGGDIGGIDGFSYMDDYSAMK